MFTYFRKILTINANDCSVYDLLALMQGVTELVGNFLIFDKLSITKNYKRFGKITGLRNGLSRKH